MSQKETATKEIIFTHINGNYDHQCDFCGIGAFSHIHKKGDLPKEFEPIDDDMNEKEKALQKLFSTMQEDCASSHHLSDSYLQEIEQQILEAKIEALDGVTNFVKEDHVESSEYTYLRAIEDFKVYKKEMTK